MNNDKKIKLELNDGMKFFFVGIIMLTVMFGIAFMAGQVADRYEEDRIDRIIEGGQENGHNWTMRNLTILNDVGAEMCSNGIQEGCDYMIVIDEIEEEERSPLPGREDMGFISMSVGCCGTLIGILFGVTCVCEFSDWYNKRKK